MSEPTKAEQKAIQHPVRKSILATVSHGKTTTVIDVLEELQESDERNISYHIRVLEDAGLLTKVDTAARHGRTVYVYAATERGEELIP